ncbi:hypothetical protein ETB97_012339 [Aspergillus alliaceus]|uniref:Uncharacterized protein n=1 Tax=Petromyces alliaceus TaxID=209559 RepID=A0A8H6A7F4_PETAA|nr:hypothetical protein ETB97_012339 [Aspergillus burnettii]
MKGSQSLASLGKEDMRLLTWILSIGHIDPSSNREEKDEAIVKAIKTLPPALRKHRLASLFRCPPTVLCRSHKELNPYAIRHVFELLRYEVTAHMESLCWYHDMLDVKLRDLVYSLRDIQYMWNPSRRGSVTFQQNKCEACILARIVGGPAFLLLLRTALLSRTATRRNHYIPRLLSFVEESMTHHECLTGQIYYWSGIWAKTMKHQRKQAKCALRSTDPVANLKADLQQAKKIVVPIGIDLETLESSQRVRQGHRSHREPCTISGQAPRQHNSDADTLAGIIGLYGELQPADEVSSATFYATEDQSDLSSVTYTGDTPIYTSTIPPLNAPYPSSNLRPIHQQPISKQKPPAKDPAGDTDDGYARNEYIPSRKEFNWQHVPGKHRPLDPLSNEPQGLWREGLQGDGGCEEIAALYQDLLGTYSESENGENSIEKRPKQDTTWGLFLKV